LFWLSHQTAAVDVRERFAIPETGLPEVLARLETMPRDIDPVVQKSDGVYLYDLDSLQSMAKRTLAVRQQESEKCHQLIEHHVQDFQLWIDRHPVIEFSLERSVKI
jgi:glutamyl-tRNA reductase